MQVLDSFLDAMGDTPLVRLSRVTRGIRPTVLAKLEMLNPGGSVKDRIGLPMIEAAERSGLLKPGGTIVEPTSGNTGHGLAIAAAIKGYKCIFVMPDKMSQEKVALLRVVGADPEGSLFSAGPGEEARPYLTEGIGEDFWPKTFDPSVVDRWVRVSDRDSLVTARAITRQEGILVGGSSGTAMFAALTVARELDGDALMVVIFPDTGRNYLSKVYSDSWMLQYGFLDRPEAIRVEEVLASKRGGIPPLVTVSARQKVRQAVDRLQEFDISQAPVVRDEAGG